uniref:RRM domain-containing protein n=1 Tax=Physcomitrium patens TaxID=3218 RepID=A0A7I4AB54_PHYPA
MVETMTKVRMIGVSQNVGKIDMLRRGNWKIRKEEMRMNRLLCTAGSTEGGEGTRGVNAAPFHRGNSGPGIMGPGRPPVPMEYGGHMPLRPIDRGFPRPIGGMVAPGRLNHSEQMQNQIRDSMAVQGHILRYQQCVQLAQEVQQAQAQAQAHAQAQAQAQVQARAHAHAQAQAQVQARAHVHAHSQGHVHAHAHAQAQVHMANSEALRASMNSSTMRPMMGLELIGGQVQASHGIMDLHVQTPDSGQQMNFLRPLEGFGSRVPQNTDFAAGRGSIGSHLLNQSSNRDRAAGRQMNAWLPASAVHHEISTISGARARAQGQSRGQVMSSLWGEPPVGGIPTGFPSPLGVIGHVAPVNVSPGIAPAGVIALGTPKRQGSLPIVMPSSTASNRENPNVKKVDTRPQVDGTWRTNGDNRGSLHNNGNSAPSSRKDAGAWSKSSTGQTGSKRSRENGVDRRHSSGSSGTGTKPIAPPNVGNGMGATGNNLIRLGGPVTKSRVLSVSGFPENTSMAVVVEAFEKQGKILDFKKDEKGNAFRITFSSVDEAVSAKRSLHRTLLNGRQITVDYTVQR